MKVEWVLFLSMAAVLVVGVVGRPQEDTGEGGAGIGEQESNIGVPEEPEIPGIPDTIPLDFSAAKPADAQPSSSPSQTAINTPSDEENVQHQHLRPGSKVKVYRMRKDDHEDSFKDLISSVFTHKVDKTQDQYKSESEVPTALNP